MTMNEQVEEVISNLESRYGSVTARLIQAVVKQKLGITLTLQEALQAFVSYRDRGREQNERRMGQAT